MLRKGISTVVSAVLIVVIVLGLSGTAYIWGTPLIQKRQEASVTENVFTLFSQTNQNSLPKMIEDVANNKGVKTFKINTDGIWKLNQNEDSIEFTFTSKTSNIAAGTAFPISLTSGVQCTGTDPYPNYPSPKNGTLGKDSASVVCVKSTQGDVFTITYKIWFRELYDNPFSPSANGFKIDLIQDPAGLATSTGRTVGITFLDSATETTASITLIKKQIKILLV